MSFHAARPTTALPQPCTVPFCQNPVPQPTDLPIVSVLFFGRGGYCPLPLSKRYEWGGFGREELRILRSNEKKGPEIWLHLCVQAEGRNCTERRVVFLLLPTAAPLLPKLASTLSAPHLAAMWRI